MKKPLIGICANYSSSDAAGLTTYLGVAGQEWQLLADDYIKAIERAGGVPIILPVTEELSTLEPIVQMLDGILFTGGSDIDPQCYGDLPRYGIGGIEPRRDSHEVALAKKVISELRIPVLGICRGSQVLNVAMGGTLYQDLRLERPDGMNHTLTSAPKHYPTHTVAIKPNSRLHAIFQTETLAVNSLNHQAVKELGQGFEETMTAPDGVIEGIEMTGERFVVAVQWHPEMMIDRNPEYLVLFEAFVNSCKLR